MAATVQHAARVLGLDCYTTVSAVRQVRREMAKKYHPDVTSDHQRATRHMARINDAADTLIAHLTKTASRKRRGQHPNYPDFTDVPPRRKTKQSTRSQRAKTEPKPDQARLQQQRKDTFGKTPSPKAKPPVVQPEGLTSRDASLTRFASQSYCAVLEQIGAETQRPNIDVHVLKF